MPGPEASRGAPVATLRDVTAACARSLAVAGVESAALDARRLVSAALGLAAADFLSAPDRAISQSELRAIEALAARRRAREPVSRILGVREFFGRPFGLSPATLDPRADSETLIELALEIAAEEGWAQRPIRILDIGTGSGCLLVTLLAEMPLAIGVGTDVSAAALETATANAASNGVGDRARFLQRNGFDGIDGPFDLVVCNPPYIPTREIEDLAPEVRDFDPRGALDGGADGLDMYRAIIPRLARIIPSGWVVFEVGAGQAESVAALLRRQAPIKHKSTDIRVRTDLGGHTRCVSMKLQL
jgi:release factor glutamine methyltransferase